MGRYLTPFEKERVLTEWRETLRSMPKAVPSDGDERGYPDPPIVPWCEELNDVTGICTVQSCCGHKRLDGTFVSGHLWLRLDKEMAARFDMQALALAGASGIERVSRLYSQWGAEVVEIVFLGNERGQLERSMQSILGFLRTLSSTDTYRCSA